MVSAQKDCTFFLKIKDEWEVASMDASKMSGGLLVAWNPRKGKIKSFLVSKGFFYQVSSRTLQRKSTSLMFTVPTIPKNFYRIRLLQRELSIFQIW